MASSERAGHQVTNEQANRQNSSAGSYRNDDAGIKPVTQHHRMNIPLRAHGDH